MSKGFTYKLSSFIFLPGILCLHYGIFYSERERERISKNFPSASNIGQTTSGQRFSNFFTYSI